MGPNSQLSEPKPAEDLVNASTAMSSIGCYSLFFAFHQFFCSFNY